MINTETDALGIKEYVNDVAIDYKFKVLNNILSSSKIKIYIDREDERTRQLTDEYSDFTAFV